MCLSYQDPRLLEARRQWKEVFKALNDNNYQVEAYGSQVSFQNKGGNKDTFREAKFDQSHHQLICPKGNTKKCSSGRRKLNSNVIWEIDAGRNEE